MPIISELGFVLAQNLVSYPGSVIVLYKRYPHWKLRLPITGKIQYNRHCPNAELSQQQR